MALPSGAAPGAGETAVPADRGREVPRRRRARPTRTGELPARIEDVAERAGVSIATVSRVIRGTKAVNPETRRRVVAAVAELNYRPSGPARALAGSRTQTLGLIMTDLSQAFYGEVARAVEAVATEHGFTIILANGAGDVQREASYLDLLAERRVDGILVASWGVTARHIDWLVHAPVEVVLLTCKAPGLALAATLAANREGARMAAEHLINLGHRRIGEISGPSYSAASVDRGAGLRDALDAAGIPADDMSTADSRGDVESGQTAAATLLALRPRPTALACYNDLVAIGAMKAARAAGLQVPEDVSIVGFDDGPLATMVEPELTTIAQPVAAMAAWAVERIEQQIEAFERGEPAPPASVVQMPCHLVTRGSTGPAPGSTDGFGP